MDSRPAEFNAKSCGNDANHEITFPPCEMRIKSYRGRFKVWRTGKDLRPVLTEELPTMTTEEVTRWMVRLNKITFVSTREQDGLKLATNVMSLMPKIHYVGRYGPFRSDIIGPAGNVSPRPLRIEIQMTVDEFGKMWVTDQLKRFLQTLADIEPARPLDQVGCRLLWPEFNEGDEPAEYLLFRITGLVGFDIVVDVAGTRNRDRLLTPKERARIKGRFLAIQAKLNKECCHKFTGNPLDKLPNEVQLKIWGYLTPHRVHFAQTRRSNSWSNEHIQRLTANEVDLEPLHVGRQLRNIGLESLYRQTNLVLASNLHTPTWHVNLTRIDRSLGTQPFSKMHSVTVLLNLHRDSLVPIETNGGNAGGQLIQGVNLFTTKWKISNLLRLLELRYGNAKTFVATKGIEAQAIQLSCTKVVDLGVVGRFIGLTLRLAVGIYTIDLDFTMRHTFEEFNDIDQKRIARLYKCAVRGAMTRLVHRFASQNGWSVEGDFEETREAIERGRPVSHYTNDW